MSKGLLVLSAVFSYLVGCALGPTPPRSKDEAVVRAITTVEPDGRLLQLPASKTGTGPFDFYSLFARFSDSGRNLTYGISVATTKKLSDDEMRITVKGGDSLPVTSRERFSAAFGKKIDSIEARFERTWMEKATIEGASFEVLRESGLMSFTVPAWMFAALLEAVDQDQRVRMARRRDDFEMRRVHERQLYVQEHPQLEQRVREAVLAGEIVLGMPSDAAVAAWGKPNKVNRTVSRSGVHEQWIYSSAYVHFDDGILTSWQDHH